MAELITKESVNEWLSDKSESYVDGWIRCEKGDAHVELSSSDYSKEEYAGYTEGYSQCFSNQACIDQLDPSYIR
jgi:hypothetical protein